MKEVESLWTKLQMEETQGNLIGVCYRPPILRKEEESDVFSQVEMVERQENIIIMGDFIYPNIDWANVTAQSSLDRYFLDFLKDNFYVSMRGRPN